MTKIFEHAKNNIFHMLAFSVAFIVLGYYIPKIWFDLAPASLYYSINTPIEVEKSTYKPGENVIVELCRKSSIDTQGTSIIELTLFSANREITHELRNVSIDKGEQTVELEWALPSNLPNGTYYFKGSVSFSVGGVTKNTPFSSKNFEVIN